MNRSIDNPIRLFDRLSRGSSDHDPPSTPLSLDPATTYEVLTRQMVQDLAAEVAAIRNRIDTLFWVILVSVATDVVLRLAGQ